MITSKEIELCKQLKPTIVAAASKYGFSPAIIAGIISRESRFGTLLDADGKGDNGHGHGLMQIDDRSHVAFILRGTWRNDADNINYGVAVLADFYDYLKTHTNLQGDDLRAAAIASFNCGPGNGIKALPNWDARTTGKDYSADVLVRAAAFAPLFKREEDMLDAKTGIEMPLFQSQLDDVFGDPGSEDFRGYMAFIDLSEFKDALGHVGGIGFKTAKGFGFWGNWVIKDPLRNALREVIAAGMADRIKTFDGCHNNRPSKSGRFTSTHAWALAVDLNAGTNPYGSELVTDFPKEFVAIFAKYGFEWGGLWKDPIDAMHFQWAWTRDWRGSSKELAPKVWIHRAPAGKVPEVVVPQVPSGGIFGTIRRWLKI